jgi:hypothetical protein
MNRLRVHRRESGNQWDEILQLHIFHAIVCRVFRSVFVCSIPFSGGATKMTCGSSCGNLNVQNLTNLTGNETNGLLSVTYRQMPTSTNGCRQVQASCAAVVSKKVIFAVTANILHPLAFTSMSCHCRKVTSFRFWATTTAAF